MKNLNFGKANIAVKLTDENGDSLRYTIILYLINMLLSNYFQSLYACLSEIGVSKCVYLKIANLSNSTVAVLRTHQFIATDTEI